MKPVYIFRHIDCEGSGYLGEFLTRHGIPQRLIALDAGQNVPDSPQEACALVFMGGPMSVNDSLPWIKQELRLIRQAYDANVPVLGHCLGGQLIAKALGAEVRPHTVKEIGWHAVEQVRSSPWLDGMPSRFEAFHWHGDTFDIPSGVEAVHLLKSAYCPHQAFVVGNMLALQFHMEVTADMIQQWLSQYPEALLHAGASIQSSTQMTSALQDKIAVLHRNADILYQHWLQSFSLQD